MVRSIVERYKTMALYIKRIRPGAKLPKYMSERASGMDVSACLDSNEPYGHMRVLEPGERTMIPTGLVLDIPYGFEVQVRPRSGMAIKKGITVINSPGTIDSDYRGELMIGLINHSGQDFTVEDGMRIAQIVIAPVVQMQVIETEEVSETDRGEGGIGSTGDK